MVKSDFIAYRIHRRILFCGLFLFVSGCGLFDAVAYNGFSVIKNSGNFQDLLFFAADRRIVGIDPETLEVKSAFQFNQILYYGGKTRDNRIIVSLDNSGDIYFIDSSGKITGTVKSYGLATSIYLFGNLLFVSSEGGISAPGIHVFNVDTYQKVHTYGANLFKGLVDCNAYMDSNILYINIYPSELYEGDWTNNNTGEIMTVNTNDLSYTKSGKYLSCRYESCDIYVSNSKMYCAYFDNHNLSVYDLKQDEMLTNLYLRSVIEFPPVVETNTNVDSGLGYSITLTSYQPIRISNDLLIFFESAIYSGISVLDASDYHFKTNIDITYMCDEKNGYIGTQSRCRYVRGSKMYFASINDITISTFDYKTGEHRFKVIYE